MIRCQPGPLSAAATTFLSQRQARVDALPTHSARYHEARRLFSQKGNKAFNEIRRLLDAASPTGGACVYCEQDRRREIEHVHPQRHYPESAFNWLNYVLSCTVCNQDNKNDRFAVVDQQLNLVTFDRHSLGPDAPPPPGTIAVINPRTEDPMDFFLLDLETGELVVHANSPVNALRAAFTRDLFDLNNDSFMRIRRNARAAIGVYAEQYRQSRDRGDVPSADRALTEIREHPHPTVLAEMQRQHVLEDIPV